MPFLCSIFLCPTSRLQSARGKRWVQRAPLPTRAGRDLDLGGLCLGRLFRVMLACKMCHYKAPLKIKLCTPSHLLWGFARCPYLEGIDASRGEGRVLHSNRIILSGSALSRPGQVTSLYFHCELLKNQSAPKEKDLSRQHF